MTLASVGEISRAAGFVPAAAPGASDREVEIAHEQNFLTHGLTLFETAVEHPDPELPWDFVLSGTVDAEQKFLEQPYISLKKMALARSLQLQHGFENALRDQIYVRYTVAEILTMLAGGRAIPPLHAGPALPPPPPPGGPLCWGAFFPLARSGGSPIYTSLRGRRGAQKGRGPKGHRGTQKVTQGPTRARAGGPKRAQGDPKGHTGTQKGTQGPTRAQGLGTHGCSLPPLHI